MTGYGGRGLGGRVGALAAVDGERAASGVVNIRKKRPGARRVRIGYPLCRGYWDQSGQPAWNGADTALKPRDSAAKVGVPADSGARTESAPNTEQRRPQVCGRRCA